MTGERPRRLVDDLLALVALAAFAPGCDARARAASSDGREFSGVARAVAPAGSAATRASPSALPTPSAEIPPPRSAAAIPAPPEPAPRKRIYGLTRFVWIRPTPDYSHEWIGYLWAGESVPLREENPVPGPGCEKWYAVEPRGFICDDGKRATTDPESPAWKLVARYAPHFDSPTPHRYAESMGAERYERLPTPAEQRAREPALDKHFARLEAARQGKPSPLVEGVDLTEAKEEAPVIDALPWQIQIPRRSFRRDSTIAFFDEYRSENRTFLLTSDFAWVPKDRTRPYHPATFQGVRLGGDVKLPLAFFREHDQPAYVRDELGKFTPAEATFARLSFVPLTGKQAVHWPYTYLETTRNGLWVRNTEAVVPTPSPYTPWGAKVGVPDTNSAKPRGRGTWVEASVYGGWLIAYEDSIPVFVTLASPGRGGVAQPPLDPTKTSSTPTGRFVVTGKFVTATMDAPDDVTHADVPWVQNFSGPHAIHAAYWHDAWGERVSGGCINVSPEDGKYLFEFSEPKLPPGWHGVRWDPHLESATAVVVHP
ncbi:MAG TPA: L,D-transpeptidase [Polyangiaceae bacterium]|nr:L,D-transpeptidase [Polyangiaceae bacterium]